MVGWGAGGGVWCGCGVCVLVGWGGGGGSFLGPQPLTLHRAEVLVSSTRSMIPCFCFGLYTRSDFRLWRCSALSFTCGSPGLAITATIRPYSARRQAALLLSMSKRAPMSRESSGTVTGWLNLITAHCGPKWGMAWSASAAASADIGGAEADGGRPLEAVQLLLQWRGKQRMRGEDGGAWEKSEEKNGSGEGPQEREDRRQG